MIIRVLYYIYGFTCKVRKCTCNTVNNNTITESCMHLLYVVMGTVKRTVVQSILDYCTAPLLQLYITIYAVVLYPWSMAES